MYRSGVLQITPLNGGEEFTLNNSYKEFAFPAQTLEGFFSVQYEFNTSDSHADARVNIDVWSSATGESYVRSSDGSNVATDIHEGSGTDSNGRDLLLFEPSVAGQYKLRFTETATQAAVLKAWLIVS